MPAVSTSSACDYVFQQLQKNQTALILRGIPGSGKSYFKKFVMDRADLDKYSCTVASADHYFQKPDGYHFDVKYLQKAHSQSQQVFIDALNSKIKLVIVDNTNTQLWEYKVYCENALKQNYTIIIVEMECPNVMAAQLFTQRNVHGVSIQKGIAMYDRWEHDSTAIEVQTYLSNSDYQHISDYASTRLAALFLTKDSKSLLLKMFPPLFNNVCGDHVTIEFQPSKTTLQGLAFGRKANVIVTNIVSDHKAQAVVVVFEDADLSSLNRHPHITISVDQDTNAVYSNELLSSDTIREKTHERIVLQGIIGIKIRGVDGMYHQVTRRPKHLLYEGEVLISTAISYNYCYNADPPTRSRRNRRRKSKAERNIPSQEDIFAINRRNVKKDKGKSEQFGDETNLLTSETQEIVSDMVKQVLDIEKLAEMLTLQERNSRTNNE